MYNRLLCITLLLFARKMGISKIHRMCFPRKSVAEWALCGSYKKKLGYDPCLFKSNRIDIKIRTRLYVNHLNKKRLIPFKDHLLKVIVCLNLDTMRRPTTKDQKQPSLFTITVKANLLESLRKYSVAS
ncbi:hypothetical protein BY458DRAFT_551063 [Sporodiniella umbellata]|nr:hypothetical protein BY458DRAFT_551063 [Sporodiniella umbellata]